MLFAVRTNEETEAQQGKLSQRTAWALRPTSAPFRQSIPTANVFVGLPSLPKGQEKADLRGISLPTPAGPADTHPQPGQAWRSYAKSGKNKGWVMHGSADRKRPQEGPRPGQLHLHQQSLEKPTTRVCPRRQTGALKAQSDDGLTKWATWPLNEPHSERQWHCKQSFRAPKPSVNFL